MLSPKIGIAIVTVATGIGLSQKIHPDPGTPAPSVAQSQQSQVEDLSDAEDQYRKNRKRRYKIDADATDADNLHPRGREIRPAEKAAERLLRRLP
jgi:hypothetical protein